MRAMRGFISKAFVLAVEGDICGFSFLSLAPDLFFYLSLSLFLLGRPTFPGIFQFQSRVGCILACVVKTEIL